MNRDSVAIANFFAAALFGVVLTQVAPYSVATWWLWAAVRVLWQVGSAIWVGRILGDALKNRAPWMLGAAALGIGLSATSALALAQGPVSGALTEVGDETGWTRSITLVTDADQQVKVWLSTVQTRKLEALPDCATYETRVTVLPALGILIEATCTGSGR